MQKLIFKALQADHPLILKLQHLILPKIVHSPLGKRIQKKIVLGFPNIKIQKNWFIDENDDSIKRTHYHKLKIIDIQSETANCKTIRIEIPQPLETVFHYKAGQFISLRLFIDGQVATRCYSISSAPSQENSLNITVKKLPGGLLSTFLNEKLKTGDVINASAPSGNFTLPHNHPAKCNYIMIAGGSGITPIISICQHLLETCDPARIQLIDVNSNSDSIICKQRIKALQSEYPDRLMVQHILSQKEGRLTLEKLKTLLTRIPYYSEMYTHFYLCGPQGLKDIATHALDAADIKTKKIHRENFTTTPAATNMEPNTSLTQVIAPDSQPGVTQSISLSINNKQSKIEPISGETILESAIRCGLNPPYSCMSGICGSCRAKLNEGEVEMDNASGLSANDLEENNILTCQAIPKSKTIAVDF